MVCILSRPTGSSKYGTTCTEYSAILRNKASNKIYLLIAVLFLAISLSFYGFVLYERPRDGNQTSLWYFNKVHSSCKNKTFIIGLS